jgi:hypothetical protein
MTGYERMIAEQREEIERLRQGTTAAVLAEREQCAKIADECAARAKEDRSVWAAEAIAANIRGKLPAPPDDPDPTGA